MAGSGTHLLHTRLYHFTVSHIQASAPQGPLSAWQEKEALEGNEMGRFPPRLAHYTEGLPWRRGIGVTIQFCVSHSLPLLNYMTLGKSFKLLLALSLSAGILSDDFLGHKDDHRRKSTGRQCF